MICPVCNTYCGKQETCPKCNFNKINLTFSNLVEQSEWNERVVKTYREKYWSTLPQFKFDGTSLKKYHSKSNGDHYIEIPYGVEKIDKKAFEHAFNLRYVDLPDTVLEIDNDAFAMCTSLTHINMSMTSKLQKIGIRAFFFCQNIEMIKLPPNVEIVKREAFSTCTSMLTVLMPEGLKKLGENMFYNCKQPVIIKYSTN